MLFPRHLYITSSICFLCSCGTSAPTNEEHLVGFGIQYDSSGEESFFAKTSDPNVIKSIQTELDKPIFERTLFIIGDIAKGNGGYNTNDSGKSWNWHFVPNKWSLTEASVEVCDGNPTLVEQSVDYWVDTVKQFCPWTSYVKSDEIITE